MIKTTKELDVALLDKLYGVLSRVDLANFVRRKPVFKASTMKTVFEEVYVSIPDLREALLPNVNLKTNPWFYAYLLEVLDKRFLSGLSDAKMTENFGLRLSVVTLLSDIFIRFDETVRPKKRSTIVLSLRLADILSNLENFSQAMGFVQSKGYKICINGVDASTLPHLNMLEADVDFIRLKWSEKLLEQQGLITDLPTNIRSKLILCGADTPQAIEVGRLMGIGLFQK